MAKTLMAERNINKSELFCKKLLKQLTRATSSTSTRFTGRERKIAAKGAQELQAERRSSRYGNNAP